MAIATLGSLYLAWGLTAAAVGIAAVCAVAALQRLAVARRAGRWPTGAAECWFARR